MRTLLALAVLALLGGPARADFDPAGWKLFGTTGFRKAGTSTINVSPYLGLVDRLLVGLERGTKAHVVAVEVHRDDDSTTRVVVGKTIDKGHPTVEVELDGSLAMIDRVTVEANHLGKRVVLAVLGKAFGVDPPTPPTTAWDHSLWFDLGSTDLSDAGASMKSLSSAAVLMVALVPTATLDVSGFRLGLVDAAGQETFAEEPPSQWVAGDAHVIDLSNRTGYVGVKSVELQAVLNGAFAARLEVYGYRDTTHRGHVTRASTSTEPDDGWTLLGEDDVDLVDDVVEIKKKKSTWSKVKIVVVGDDVELTSLDLQLAGKAAAIHDDVAETFEDGAAHVIDIPGKRRAITKVRLQYKKHHLDGTTQVRVYAR